MKSDDHTKQALKCWFGEPRTNIPHLPGHRLITGEQNYEQLQEGYKTK